MRLLSPVFIDAFPNAILNVHPSLLPAFPGLDAQHQAWAHGVKVSGRDRAPRRRATSTRGPIVLQRTVPVLEADTPDSLAARILVEEHRLYPRGHWRSLAGAGAWRALARAAAAIALPSVPVSER